MKSNLARNRAVRLIRQFFDERKILEVRTPRIVPTGTMEPYMDVLTVEGRLNGVLGTLATSPEISMKKILCKEIQQTKDARGIYEIAAAFRDDRQSALHSPEFTMVEWYRTATTLREITDEACALIQFLANAFHPEAKNIPVYSFFLRELFERGGLSLTRAKSFPFSSAYLQKVGSLPHHVNATDGEVACFNLLFDEIVLPQIKRERGLFCLSEFPPALAALSRVEEDRALRTEIYFKGVELANAYQEEDDVQAVKARWHEANTIRRLNGAPVHPIDEEFLECVPEMAGVSGVALGLERVLHLVTSGVFEF